MRRRLAPLTPAFWRLYGLHPWDLERLTGDEIAAHLNEMMLRSRSQEVTGDGA